MNSKIVTIALAESFGLLETSQNHPPLPKRRKTSKVSMVDKDTNTTKIDNNIGVNDFDNNVTITETDEDATITNNIENDTWSTEKCVLCNNFVVGESKILKCLHIICNDCLFTKITNSSVQCKCLVITEDELIDYPIVSPNVSSIKICSENDCIVEAKKICNACNTLFCIPCSKSHLYSKEDHDPEFIHTYPSKNEFISCSNCLKSSKENIYCIDCSIIICSICFINSHRIHNYKILEDYGVETKKELFVKKLFFEKNKKYLNFCIDQTHGQLQDLERQKKYAYEHIDKEVAKLHEEIDKRAIELKRSVDKVVSETVKTADDNTKLYKDILQENTYYISLTESILNHSKICDIINLSKFVLPKTINDKNNEEYLSKNVAGNKINLKFEYEESLNNCISFIQKFGIITSFKALNSSEKKNTESSNNVIQSCENQVNNSEDLILIKSEDQDNALSDSDGNSSIYEPLVFCSCCNQRIEQFIKCKFCNRIYHNECHIPEMTPTNDEELLANWKCAICQNINTNYNQNDIEDISPGTLGRKVIEQILLRLFCQNNDSEHFRDCPKKNLYPMYYERVAYPISLNDIRNRLKTNIYYAYFTDVINDLKQVFSNALSYYSYNDPFYISATNLQTSLYRMLK